MITESTAPRNEVLPKSQTPPPQSVCLYVILSLFFSLSLSLSLIFTPTFPIWPRHPAGIFWDHFPWLISSQLISDDWRLTTPPAMHSLCGSHTKCTTLVRGIEAGSLYILLQQGTKFTDSFVLSGNLSSTVLFDFVWKGFAGDMLYRFCWHFCQGGDMLGICALSFGNHFKAVLCHFFFLPFFSFLFHHHLHCCYIYFNCSYLYNY